MRPWECRLGCVCTVVKHSALVGLPRGALDGIVVVPEGGPEGGDGRGGRGRSGRYGVLHEPTVDVLHRRVCGVQGLVGPVRHLLESLLLMRWQVVPPEGHDSSVKYAYVYEIDSK